MKNLAIIITVMCMTISMNIQASNYSIQPVDNNVILPVNLADNMNILSIKADINSRNYLMTGSFTVLKRPSVRDVDVAKTVDISFRNEVIVLPSPSSSYIQANVKATRNDNNSVNEFRIYVHQDSGSQGNIDKRNIKINWKTGSLEVVAKLANVSIIYQEDSILIIGTMQKNGYTIGVSLAISKDTRLI